MVSKQQACKECHGTECRMDEYIDQIVNHSVVDAVICMTLIILFMASIVIIVRTFWF
jgi:hypothetical protein